MAAIESARLVSWRYPLADNEGAILGQADILVSEPAKLGAVSPDGFESILTGLFGIALEQALLIAERQFADMEAELEIRLLEAPEFRQSFLFCRDHRETYLLPYFRAENVADLLTVLPDMRFVGLERLAEKSFEDVATVVWRAAHRQTLPHNALKN